MRIKETKDYDVIAKLNRHVQDLHVALYPEIFRPYNYETMKIFFKNKINKPSYIFLLIEEDGKPLGYAWIEIRDYSDTVFKKAYQSVYVHQISIMADKRNEGYGSGLMENIYKTAQDKGIDLIELDYWCINETAKTFYKKHGFIKSREFVYKKL
ncbi:ribosomal protein S18 acetylase RimI-like enzyme [Scopulibacillus darangshiensis]|uniref:Ribosomal protein S18 acetylase RimI-like enzyme n=1 Tax=Scopulibacillus darangshiensis TaxID=442528 RepID=A0A4R2P4Y9_9BACL|nr:GNAT family N-acetyltransferase [Scopulibacillus darangshiensis]TCP29727.1 ribosomal protein S18 acetylase RimI-like enzyme [Scopulibacillus darangshiensis]